SGYILKGAGHQLAGRAIVLTFRAIARTNTYCVITSIQEPKECKPKRPVCPSVGPSLPHCGVWGQGFDPTSIRRLPGLTDLSDPDLRVPEASVESAWRMAANVSRSESIGLHVAESLP